MTPPHHLRRTLAGGIALAAALSATTLAQPNASAEPGAAPSARGEARRHHDDSPAHPLKLKGKRDAQKQVALERKLKGKARNKSAKSVRLETEGTDRIFVVLAEFGNERYPLDQFSDSAPVQDPQPERFDGPLHNQIPKPDRSRDNATLWQPDYDRAHYQDMYFNRMRSYYERQSSGRYSISGDVTEWVKVPFNEALYGRNYCGDITCSTSKALVRDALAIWVQDQLDSGKTMSEITAYLETFDKQDRYDLDGDGDLNEPDGFIDHFQIVHAGGDEASADPTYGSDAIWSHRWYSNLQGDGPGGLPGVNIGSNDGLVSSDEVPDNPTGVWVGDYTIQPENGGLGVFAHEFGHDLGLPDLYDTSGNTGGAENSTAFWTLMSSGANIGDGGPDGIGDAPTDLGVWELFQLGWLDAQGDQGPFYDVADAGEKSTHRIASNVPATRTGKQALFTVLPDRQVPLELGAPYAGEQQFWSTRGNDLNTTMTHAAGPGALTAQVRYDIETDWDYAFLEAQVNGTWTAVPTNLSDTAGDQSGNNTSQTGLTGSTGGEWKQLTATLPAGTTAVRFRYQTDAAAIEDGFRVDQIAVDGTLIGTAETADEGWTFDGFVRTTGGEVQTFFNAYVAENRQYDGYDRSLRTAYNFATPITNPDRVESYPYQNGLLVSYWNDQYSDNNVGDHPGAGLILPVDAHPTLPHWNDGTLMRPRAASYDSTFGLERTDPITLHTQVAKDGRAVDLVGRIPSQKAVPVFDDTATWWFGADAHGATGEHPGRYQPGWYSVDVPRTGTTIRVVASTRDALVVKVAPKK